MRFLTSLLAIVIGFGSARGDVLTRVAGGLVGDGRPALEAPTSAGRVGVNRAGDVYFADGPRKIFGNNRYLTPRVRRVDHVSGIVTTIAGNGSLAGHCGDGGPATDACLGLVDALAFDGAGNVYLSETAPVGNSQQTGFVRRIDATTGTITRIAGSTGPCPGGPLAADSCIDPPAAMAVDTAGNVFVAFLEQVQVPEGYVTAGQVFRIDAVTNQMTLVAGNGQRTYCGDGGLATAACLTPKALAVDAAGNLLIADDDPYPIYYPPAFIPAVGVRIRRVDAVTGLIATIAGNGSTSICGDGGPAAAACLGPSARLAVDAADDLYVSTGTRIRRIDAATGRIDPFAGNGNGGYCGDGGPAVDACLSAYDIGVDGDGNLFASSSFRVRRVDVTTGTIATVAGNGKTGVFCGDGGPAAAACLDSPTAVAVGSGGAVFVLDGGNDAIRRIDASGAITTIAAAADPYTVSIITDAAGRLYVLQPAAVSRVDEATGALTRIAGGGTSGPFCGDGGPATAACFRDIGGAAFDAAGNLYIADTGNYRLRRVDAATGIVTTVPVNGSGYYYFAPLTVATDPAGGVYLENDFDNSLVHVDPATGQSAPVQYNAVPGAPFIECGFNPKMSLATDAAGNLYVADLCTVDRIDVGTHLRYTIAGTGSQFPCDESTDPLTTCLSTLGMTVDAAARIFIADSIGDRLWRVDGAPSRRPPRRRRRRPRRCTAAGSARSRHGAGQRASRTAIRPFAALCPNCARTQPTPTHPRHQ